MFLKANSSIIFGKLLIISSLVIAGCSPTQSTTAFPTSTFSKSLPPTWTPTITLTPTETQTPTPLPTSLPTYTSTPFFSYVTPIEPTLIDSDAKQILNNMLAQNGSCKLPCWWGMQPGLTNWEDARNSLNSFVGRIEELEYTDFSENNAIHNHIISVIYYQRGKSSESFEIRSIDGIIESVAADQDSAFNYSLSNILSDYGSPHEVYINTTYASPTGEVPFNLVVDYSEMGFMAFYTESASIYNKKIYFCSKNRPPVWLYLWNPSPTINEKNKAVFLDALDYWIYSSGFHPIQEASYSYIEQFYLNFKDSDSKSCLISSTDTWAAISSALQSPALIFPTVTPSPIYPWEEKTPTLSQ